MIASGQRSRSASALTPGFRLSLGITLSVLAALVVLPLSALAFRVGGLGWEGFWAAALSEQALASYRLTLASSAAAAVCNGLFGLVTAWTLVRYKPPGRGLLDSLIDLPFAVPGAIGGLALAAMVGPGGLLGQVLLPLGIEIAYTRSAVFFALMYSGLPFVVRSVQPVIESLDPAEEEAAALLGASRGQVFFRIVLPSLLPALASGCLMAFIRGLGEFGTVVFISGNIPFDSEVTTQLIFNKIQQFDRDGAAAVSLVLVGFSAIAMAIAGLAGPLLQRIRDLRDGGHRA